MGFDWGDEPSKYRVQVMPLADGRFTWRLIVNERRGAGIVESFEDAGESFESPDAAEEAGKNRMIELARADTAKSE